MCLPLFSIPILAESDLGSDSITNTGLHENDYRFREVLVGRQHRSLIQALLKEDQTWLVVDLSCQDLEDSKGGGPVL